MSRTTNTSVDKKYGAYDLGMPADDIKAALKSGAAAKNFQEAIEIGDSDTLRAAKEYTDKTALKEIPPASINVLGGIKPLLDGSGTINRSGLVISKDGTTYVNTRADRGITRDGAGQIHINPATDDEVAAGNEGYKPVTPKTLYNELYRRGVYTTHPEKMGMWIDGTPVWRVAFRASLDETMKANKAFLPFENSLFVISREDVELIIGGFASIDNGSIIDNNATTLDATGEFSWNNINPDAEYISGYVEFVTPESNIKVV